MKKYDCIVVGQDLYSLIVALYLSRKMRKVLIVQNESLTNSYNENVNIKVDDRVVSFRYYRNNLVAGLNKSGLLYAYLDNLGLEKELDYEQILYEVIIDSDGGLKKRFNSLEQFRVYLIRYYPKSRKEINRFFEEIERHYANYKEQYLNMLSNNDYTLSSLMIEWGDLSLVELLKKHFNDIDLINEFSINDYLNGLDIKEVSAYSFFSTYFCGLKDGFFLLKNSYQEICEKCVEKIKLINPQAFSKTTIKEYVVNDKGEVETLIDSQNNIVSAKYYYISDKPLNFYKKHFKNKSEDMDLLSKYYPNLESKRRINTVFLVLNTKLTDVGLEEMIYYFRPGLEERVSLIRMLNYSKASNQDLRRKEGLLCVDFAYYEGDKINEEIIINKLDKYFPKIKKAIKAAKLGKAQPYLSMLRDETLRKNLSINELIDVESLEHIQVVENLFVGGEFIKPEAKFNGVVNQSIVFADKIEDKLYYGDNEGEDHKYFTNDEIMMMIRHNYNYKEFGPQETHVNFQIGKSNYFVRTKGKNIVIHHGKYSNADLSIYITNDKLADLLLGKVTFSDVLDAGFLKYRGDITLLFQAVKAFKLDDYQEYSQEEYLLSRHKYFGVKLFFAHIFIYALAAFFSNYYDNIWIFPSALLLSITTSFIRFKVYESISWFDIFITSILGIYSILSIFVPWFNNLRADDIFLAVIIITLMVSVFTNQPVVYLYHKYDVNIDYRNAKLFKIITNGLTFIWGFIFLVILGGTYIAGDRYVSVFYSFLFLGIFMTYYYPTIYVKTSIKK